MSSIDSYFVENAEKQCLIRTFSHLGPWSQDFKIIYANFYCCSINNHQTIMTKDLMATRRSLPSLLLLMAFVLSINSAIIPATITPQTMDNLLSSIDNLFFANNAPGTIQLRKFLRAAFHDCMGGCDGRVNLENTDNRGLEGLVSSMDRIYRNNSYPFKSTLSRADFFVLCEVRALAWGIKRGDLLGTSPVLGPDYVVYKYGRFNSTAEPGYDDIEGPFPDGIANWTGTGGASPSIMGGLTAGLKGLVSEYDVVALLGLHNAGNLVQKHSGFQGVWGEAADLNRINNGMYKFMIGWQSRNFDLEQTHSYQHNNGTAPERSFLSSPPTFNKLQWTRVNKTEFSRVLINADMGIYHNFTASSDGTAPGKYCPQGNNATLFDCSKKDPSYMPLSHNAQQAYSYIANSTLFYSDLIAAFLRLTSVPSEYDGPYVDFRPQYVCESGVPVCRGDVLLQNCKNFSVPSC